MTDDGQDWRQPPQYPPQGYGQPYPQGQPQHRDPRAQQVPPGYWPPRRPLPPSATPPQWQQDPPQQREPPRPRATPGTRRPSVPPRQPPAPAPGPAPKAKAGDGPSGRVRAGCLVVALAVIGCIARLGWSIYGSSGNGTPAAAPATTSAAQAKAQAKALAKVQAEAAACAEKTPGRDVYVRTVDPGEDTEADDTGGDWQWNYGKNECMSAVQYALSQVVPFGGDCVTVAYASDNPGYDTDSDPAPPLNDVIAEAGPGC